MKSKKVIRVLFLLVLVFLLLYMYKSIFRKKEDLVLIKKYKFDSSLFTQGLEIDGKQRLVVGTGLYGDSRIGIYDFKTESFKEKARLDESYFGEGLTLTPGGIWQLTWRNKKAFLRNEDDFKVIKTADYEGEGWGLAYNDDDKKLYMSDGTSNIYVRDPISFKLLDSFKIFKDGLEIDKINELEIHDGFIYANIWMTNKIIKISIKDKKLVKEYDFTKILDQIEFTSEEKETMDVLNGIAHIRDKRFFISGKHYPYIFELELNN